MANPIFNQMQGGGMGNIWTQITRLKNQLGGNPEQHIQQLLNSGKVSQADYDRAVQRAQELRRFFGK